MRTLKTLAILAALGLPASSTHEATPADYRPLAHEMLQELIEIKSSDSGVLSKRLIMDFCCCFVSLRNSRVKNPRQSQHRSVG